MKYIIPNSRMACKVKDGTLVMPTRPYYTIVRRCLGGKRTDGLLRTPGIDDGSGLQSGSTSVGTDVGTADGVAIVDVARGVDVAEGLASSCVAVWL